VASDCEGWGNFEERSINLLNIFHIELRRAIKINKPISVVYFHNLSRFDGILLLKFYTSLGGHYAVKPLIRDNQVYEIVVYCRGRVIIRFRDSLKLLPGSLDSLGGTLCPHLGFKKNFDHINLTINDIGRLTSDIVNYLQQDIRMLAGVMRRAQDIYMAEYSLDIVDRR